GIERGEYPERVGCRYVVTAGQVDPLAALLDRVAQGLARRTAEGLDQGSSLRGKGWLLDRAGLRRGKRVYPLDEISWVGFFDRRVCIWRGNDERPALRIPLLSRNAGVLGLVLWQQIQKRPGHDQPVPD